MVLPMIAKEVAAQESPKVIFGLAARFMLVVWRMFAAVRQVGAKVKKLKGSQNAGHHPVKNYILLRKNEFQQVIGYGHGHYLPYGNVLPQKTQVPDKEIAAGMVVGIFFCGHKAVVLVVFRKEPWVPVVGK